MNDREFPIYRKQNHSKVVWDQKKPVNGMDTETYKGKASLICRHNAFVEPDCIKDVLDFLTEHSTRSAINTFFNLGFDDRAMMKWLDDDLLEELIMTNRTEYENYKIFHIEGKFLSITKNKNVSQFYDVSHYYDGNLKDNMKKYLGIEKLDTINASLLNTNYRYYMANREKVIEYCLRDALGAKQLTELLLKNYHTSLGIYPPKLISTANVTGHYYKSQTYIPSLNAIMKETPEVIHYYWRAYMGGRFEVLRKGQFNSTVYDYDLKSAYPSTIHNLININQGKWKKVDQVNEDSYYGVYKCLCSVKETHCAPFGYRVKGRITYPQNYEDELNYLTKKEVAAYKPYASIQILDGWEFYPNRIIRPFAKVVDKIFTRKEEIAKEFGKNSSEYDVIKKSLNTFYGLTVNVNDGVTGWMFNPIFGAEITCDCRCEVYKQALASGNSVIAIETDGIWTDKEIPGIRLDKGLGKWTVDEYPWLFLSGSGQLASEGVLRTRGTPRKRVGDIVAQADKFPHSKSIQFSRQRPVGSKEALILNRMKLEDINMWHKFTTSIGCNGDRGRKWERNDFTFGELRVDNFSSEPWSSE